MKFEFDPAKSARNKDKHGIDFVEAQVLWADEGLEVVLSKSRMTDEARFLAIGRIKVNTGRRSARCGARRSGSSRFGGHGKKRWTIMKAVEATKAPKAISAAELDEKFDNGEDVSEYFDWSKARRPNQEPRRVNVDFPAWMVRDLDKEAGRLGVTRQSLIKMWIAERLQ